MPPQARLWKTTEEARLAVLYPDTPMAQIVELLGRPKAAIYRKARKNGLKRSPAFLFWSESEEAKLAELYPDTPMQQLMEVFGRPKAAIYRKARENGLMRSPAFQASEHSGRMQKANNRGVSTRFKKRVANEDSFAER